jgi:hypothetical protein
VECGVNLGILSITIVEYVDFQKQSQWGKSKKKT